MEARNGKDRNSASELVEAFVGGYRKMNTEILN